MTLEEILREAAQKGLTHLSLSPTPSADGKTTYWAAQATPSTMHKYISCAALDPVDAVTQVLQALPKAPKRHPKNPNPNLYGSGVTAAVTDDPPEGALPNVIDTWLPKP